MADLPLETYILSDVEILGSSERAMLSRPPLNFESCRTSSRPRKDSLRFGKPFADAEHGF